MKKNTSHKTNFLFVLTVLLLSTFVHSDGPRKELTQLTNCTKIKLHNVMTGYLADYTFRKGMSKQERRGFIKREKVKANGCILPSLKPRQIAYLEVDTKELNSLGGNWSMQCVKSNNIDYVTGDKEPRSEYPSRVNYLSGKDLMLHCGHNVKHVEECAKGSNSTRSGEWDKLLKKKGRTMLSFDARSSTLAPKNGEKLYCQYYNDKTDTSLFAFEYLRKP